MTRSVALTGDVFDPSGTLTGGSRARTSSILTKLQELLDCEGEVQEKEGELRGVVSQLEKVKSVADKYESIYNAVILNFHVRHITLLYIYCLTIIDNECPGTDI